MSRQERNQRRRRNRRLIGAGLVVASGALAAALLVGPGGNDSNAAPRPKATAATRRARVTTTTSTAPPVVAPYARWVQTENAKPGTTNWRLYNEGKQSDIQGYADATSVNRGGEVRLHVSTTAPSYMVEVYRMGWYQGLGGRLVWSSPSQPGVHEPDPVLTSPLGTVEARWPVSMQLTVGADWPPGDYLLKLRASTGQERYVPLTVRDDSSHAAYVVMNAVTTWEAYNKWGGCSLYMCPGKKLTRAKVVSFDRPYAAETGGTGDFVGNELPLVMRMEEAGLDVTYLTSVDLHEHPELLVGHKALISLGHDEYWSKAMFDGAQRARDAGTNIAFLGANAVYRQIRLEPSALGPDRHIVNYRSTDDPIRSVRSDETTVSFRQSPVNRPEATLIGQQYECNPVKADLVVTDPTAWIYDGTGVVQGQHLDTVVGTEYDRFHPGDGGPKNVDVFAHSPVRCNGTASYSDVTYYTAPSGAGVFATGTNLWVSKLTPPGDRSPFNATVTRITMNVLLAFGTGPAGTAHPSAANWQSLPGLGKTTSRPSASSGE